MKKLFFTILLGLSFLTFIPLANAQSTSQQSQCDILKQQIESAGGGRAASLPQYCNTNQVYEKISSFLYYLVGIGAVISLMYGGYVYMTAASNDSRKTKGKNIILYTIAGLVVVLLATVIVTAVINLVVDNKLF